MTENKDLSDSNITSSSEDFSLTSSTSNEQSSYDEFLNENERRSEGIVKRNRIFVKSWKFLVIILTIISVVLFFLFTLFLILYIREKNKTHDSKRLGGEVTENTRIYDDLLTGMHPYRFSQNSEDNSVFEGLLFLPNENADTSFTSDTSDLTYAFFEVSKLSDLERPVKWICRGVCYTTDETDISGRRRSSTVVKLPTLTFFLFSISLAAAMTYYRERMRVWMGKEYWEDEEETRSNRIQEWIDAVDPYDGEEEITDCDYSKWSGESGVEKGHVECEMEQQLKDDGIEGNEDEEYHYECTATAVMDPKAADEVLEKNGIDFHPLWRDRFNYRLPNWCVLDPQKYDLSQAYVMGRKYFSDMYHVVDEAMRKHQEMRKEFTCVKELIYHGCKQEEGHWEDNADKERCDNDILEEDNDMDFDENPDAPVSLDDGYIEDQPKNEWWKKENE